MRLTQVTPSCVQAADRMESKIELSFEIPRCECASLLGSVLPVIGRAVTACRAKVPVSLTARARMD